MTEVNTWQYHYQEENSVQLEKAVQELSDLFEQCSAYRGMTTCHDPPQDSCLVYLVIYEWDSKKAFDVFKDNDLARYGFLIERIKHLTAARRGTWSGE